MQSIRSQVGGRPQEPALTVYLRMPAILKITGLGESTIHRLVAKELFPRPVRLGPRAVGWRRSDIDRWSADRAESKR